MTKSLAPLVAVLAAILTLSACAEGDDMWGHHRHRDHDGDNHLVGSQSVHPGFATSSNVG